MNHAGRYNIDQASIPPDGRIAHCARVVAAFVVVVLPWVESDQSSNMAMAGAHIPIVEAAFRSHHEFREVRLEVFTGCSGALFVGAIVDTEADYLELRQLVVATKPPMAIFWAIEKPNREYWLEGCDDSFLE